MPIHLHEVSWFILAKKATRGTELLNRESMFVLLLKERDLTEESTILRSNVQLMEYL